MTITSSLPVSTILRTVWDDLGELSVRLRSQSIIACASAAFFALIGAIPAISDNRMLAEVLDLIGAFVLVPFEIAIYRLLILGEAASGYRFDISTVRFRRMLGWTAGFWVLTDIPLHLPGAVAPSDGAEVIISIVSFALVVFAVLRLTIFLPAVAADAPGALVRNAFADTGGHAWLIIKAYFITALPFILIIISIAGLAWLGGAHDIRSGIGSLAANVFSGALGFLVWTCCAIVSARLFMKIGDRVKRSGPEAGE
ncbi:hypothetical protein V1294_001775 [Bradyrhizobium sp. AZCC 1678]|uniref:hypothetical protein n=1 Tax=Bradyrhizobium sp. AZCC 1678 TaxID=3117030 RepID=UPI002FF2F02B